MRIGFVSEGDDRWRNEKEIYFKKWHRENFNCWNIWYGMINVNLYS